MKGLFRHGDLEVRKKIEDKKVNRITSAGHSLYSWPKSLKWK
jgi:hypothetical protein